MTLPTNRLSADSSRISAGPLSRLRFPALGRVRPWRPAPMPPDARLPS